MSDYKNIGEIGEFNGTVSWLLFDKVGVESKPIVKVRCEDETGASAFCTIWCGNDKEKKDAANMLAALGVSGDSVGEVLVNSKEQLTAVACTFETEESKDGKYINAIKIRPKGADYVGPSRGIDVDDFAAAVNGGSNFAPKPDGGTKRADGKLPF